MLLLFNIFLFQIEELLLIFLVRWVFAFSYCKEIQPVHSKGDQPWVFFGRNDAKAETPILWPPHVKSWLIGKDSDVGRDWGQEEKGMTEDEMAGWHHWLDGREFGWTQGVGDGQGGLACCNSWGRKESDMTEQLNWTEGGFNGDELLQLLLIWKSLSLIHFWKTVLLNIVFFVGSFFYFKNSEYILPLSSGLKIFC